MVDHLPELNLCNQRRPLLDLSSNTVELMDLNIEMSCMNISEANSQCNNTTVNIHSVCIVGNVENQVTDGMEANNPNQRRSLRKRIRPVDYSKEKVEPIAKIQKLNKGPVTQVDIEKFYLCKNTKVLHPTLETIYEDPKNAYNKSKRKLKRSIQFDQDSMLSNKLKVKKRLNRAKQLPSSNNFLNRRKVSMECLLKKLSNLESDTD